jgi:beta-glucosidase/6-phospho-beta-glucosidase/beta-galactosidase
MHLLQNRSSRWLVKLSLKSHRDYLNIVTWNFRKNLVTHVSHNEPNIIIKVYYNLGMLRIWYLKMKNVRKLEKGNEGGITSGI